MMKFIRKHRTFSITILVVLVIFLTLTITFGRYIRNIVYNFILESQAFYFNSSILNVNGKSYSITNWDGVNSYTLTIDLNNRKNDARHTQSDIEYDIFYDCPNTVTCTLSETSGVIHSDDITGSYQLIVTPNQNFYEGDSVVVSTSVESTSPYRKQMSATYTIGVEKSNFSYEIVDSVNSKYLTINFTNAISYYEVSDAFGDYTVGSLIGIDEYNALSSQDQEKCFSAIITLEYDPDDLMVDMTNSLFINRLSSNYLEETINGSQYVKKFSFKIGPSSSNSIIFYKNDLTQNYTYPIVNNTSIIQVTATIAD